MLSRYLISIRVWGIECRLFSSRFYHSLLTDRRNRLHTFFFIYLQFGSRAGKIAVMKILLNLCCVYAVTGIVRK